MEGLALGTKTICVIAFVCCWKPMVETLRDVTKMPESLYSHRISDKRTDKSRGCDRVTR